MKKISIDEAMAAVKVAVINTFNERLRIEAERALACGESWEAVQATVDEAKALLDAWFPEEMAKLRKQMIISMTH